MLNNIFQALETLGLSAQKRAIHAQFSNSSLNDQVFLQYIEGTHQLNQGIDLQLVCLSTSAVIPLKSFIGSQVAIDIVTDRAELNRISGIVTQADVGASDGSLTLYKLRVQDPTALWKHRRNSRVFMAKSVVDVIQTIFKEWQSKSPLFAASLTLDISGLSKDYDVRPFIMQSNESDYDFLTRLMRSEGINWLIDEAKLKVASSSEQIEAQKLRLIDDNTQYNALNRRNIRFHRSSATETQDSITAFVAQRSLQPNAVHVQRWQADALEQEEGAGSVQSKHHHSDQHDNQQLALEQAWHFSPAWIQDLNGEDGTTKAGNAQIEKLNQNLGQYYDAQAKQFVASSTVRDTQVGYWFELNEHPEIDQHQGADKEFLIISKSFYNQNNLPKDLTDQVHTLLQHSQWHLKGLNAEQTDERQANQLTLQRRNIALVPEYNPLQHRPAAHPQRAKVVGPSGDEIHVDEWGRIKVRFLFTRADDHSHDGGAGANNNDTDSAWVDVLTPWAGEGYGARFLPRIGEIVVIDFFDGNIDRPYVVGRIHEAQRSPTKFDNTGKLPDTKKLAGIKSKEYQGEGFNQLRFDDTTGQISTQLQSSHAVSQLNLGKLSHPKDKAESEDRGEGFELRTDQWGAVRAGQGLLLSTQKQDQAQGEHLDAQPAKQQLEGNQSNAKALSEVAKNQQTDEIESVEQLKEFAEQIEEKIARFNKALLLLSSPAGIGLSTNEDIHVSADGQINQLAGDSINLSTQKNLITHAQNRISLFAAQNGFKQVAAKGKFEAHAQSDGLDLLAKQGIQIMSTEDRIEITSPKEIVITAGGSQIKLNGSGIFPVTGGKFEVKAGQHLFMGGSSVSTQSSLPPPPKRGQGVLELLHDYKHGEFVKQGGYQVIDSLGQQFSGQLDDKGFVRVSGLATGAAKVVFEDDKRNPWDEASDFKRPPQWPNENDPDAQTLLGKAETGLKNAVSSAKNALGQSFTSPSSVLKTLETAKELKAGGAKALLPMLQQGVESQLIDQVTGLTSKGFSNTQQTGQAVINGLKNTISEQPINPLRQYIRAKDTETDQNRKLDTMNMTFK
ncbi:type VI secretion system tip protein VgrG [Acinetobacter vivianii]|uniref:type VI secretion system Vgr family protein n=1 Tax=Acinetobacter vivianii TaxID=1776742 RepID=UPI002DBE1914|nr:type VI secretion system Vgr family protein [Acinetobacter vivianii]MEB6667002.1 type VI secretion system tip protein VgrG [Acinetobacter vivianii]